MHGHYLKAWGIRKVVIIWRDGRDVMVSWYHQCLFCHEYGNTHLVEKTRAELAYEDYENIRRNLPTFLEYVFSRQKHPGFTWPQFVREWYGRRRAVFTCYEDLSRDPASELRRVVLELSRLALDAKSAADIAERWSFPQRAGRSAGREDKSSFLRKGIVGDWKNNFSAEACEIFEKYAGAELRLLGYERDGSWLDSDSVSL